MKVEDQCDVIQPYLSQVYSMWYVQGEGEWVGGGLGVDSATLKIFLLDVNNRDELLHAARSTSANFYKVCVDEQLKHRKRCIVQL